jgi:ATP-dependent DNA helicase DinG
VSDSDSLAFWFSQEGPLSALIEGYVVREQQLELAHQIEKIVSQRGKLIAEAGTGTGKTFAYLIPAMLGRERVIISTGTKTLQEQLYHRDIPIIRKALRLPVAIAMLKGRSNYLCHQRLEREMLKDRYESRQDIRWLRKIVEWRGRTSTGDLSELTSVPEDAAIRSRVCSQPDSCRGNECDHIGGCYLADARRKAMDADVLVINHHLLFADMMLKEEGLGEVLPGAAAYILDEAHQLPEIASLFFGQSLASRQCSDLIEEIRLETQQNHLESAQLNTALQNAVDLLHQINQMLGGENSRQAWVSEQETRITPHLIALAELFCVLGSELENWQSSVKTLAALVERCADCVVVIQQFSGSPAQEQVRWFETFTKSFVLRETPLDISSRFREQIEKHPAAWIFTSATLAVKGTFDHFSSQMGLEGAETLLVGSPFDYANHAWLYLPRGFPEPDKPDYHDKVIRLAELLTQASRGRAFLLFTSHRALRLAAERLQEVIPWTLLVQGDMPKMELLNRFYADGQAVLLGTTSFWEGVDVRGPALSLVMIDKLPFAAPNDPVMVAKREWYQKKGKDPFNELQVPQAAILLKQGVGRLIRDEKDRGVMVICDPRLKTRRYGKVFLESLPPMKQENRYSEIIHFLEDL